MRGNERQFTSFSTAFQQLFHSFSTAYRQLIHNCAVFAIPFQHFLYEMKSRTEDRKRNILKKNPEGFQDKVLKARFGDYPQLFRSFSTAFPQLIRSLSTALPQLFNSFSTAFQQLYHSFSTAFQQLFYSFPTALP